MAPAQGGLSSQVPPPASFGARPRHAHAVEDFVADAGQADLPAQCQGDGHDGVVVGPHEAIELSAIRQGGEGRTQVALGVAIKGTLARKLAPLAPSAPK